MIFGAFGSKSTYYLVLGICGIYIIVSIIILIISIWKVVKYNNTSKRIFKIVLLVSIILFIISFCCARASININKNKNSIFNNKNIEMKNNSLINTDDIEIKLESITYKEYTIELQFNLKNKSDKYYNFNVYKLKVNDKDMPFGTMSNSNFEDISKYVGPYNNSNNYVMYFEYDNLIKYNIEKNQIKKLSFKLLLYKSENGDTSFEKEESNDYIDIELK